MTIFWYFIDQMTHWWIENMENIDVIINLSVSVQEKEFIVLRLIQLR